MRVLVFEYITGGGLAGRPMVPSLVAEGDMMLNAMARDLVALDGVEVSICRDRRLDAPPLPLHVQWVDNDWMSAWLTCLKHVDAVLPIAPETDGILESLCRAVQRSGRILLNSRPEAVALAASKQATLERLAGVNLPVVQSWRLDHAPSFDDRTLVVKPDLGVGCQDIHLVNGEHGLAQFAQGVNNSADWLVQPYVPGQAVSLSLMVSDDCMCVLGRNLQRIAQVDDGFMLLGCVVNGWIESTDQLTALGRTLCDAIPGLWGYVGVDLIISERGPVILEVNPRLTTSYVGLSRSIGRNVAELMMRLAEGPAVLPGQHMTGDSVHVDLEMGRVA